MLAALYASVVRTVIPVAVALAATYGAKAGLDVDTTALASLLGGLVGSAYYTVVRVVESRYPAFTWLLGTKTQPAGYSYDGSLHSE